MLYFHLKYIEKKLLEIQLGYRKQYGVSLKKKKTELPHEPTTSLLGI